MALSNSPKETLTSMQILLDIAEAVRLLVSDPKSLERNVRLAFEMPEQERLKAEEARKVIEENQKLVFRQKENLAEIDARSEELALRESALKKLSEDIKARTATLDARDAQFKKDMAELRALQRELESGQAQLNEEKKINIEFRNSLDQRQSQLAEQEALLKNRAAQLRVLAEGL